MKCSNCGSKLNVLNPFAPLQCTECKSLKPQFSNFLALLTIVILALLPVTFRIQNAISTHSDGLNTTAKLGVAWASIYIAVVITRASFVLMTNRKVKKNHRS